MHCNKRKSVKYYFSCESTKTYVSVKSSDSSLGEVSINSETYVSSRYTVVANGTSVTIHAKKIDDFVDEKFVSFKGWRLNGSEEYVSTSEDYTFTTVQDGSYKFVAEFDTAETELFDCGTKVPLATGYYHTYVYSGKVEKYYAIEGVSVDSGEHTNQTLNTNELFVESEYLNGQKLTFSVPCIYAGQHRQVFIIISECRNIR